MQETVLETFRLSPVQRHLCALHSPDTYFPYRTHCTVRLEGSLNIARLQTGLKHLVERYEILRTTFPRLPGLALPVQVIAVDYYPVLSVHDLSFLPSQEQEEAILKLRDAACSCPINLAVGPLFQATLITIASQSHLLFLDIAALNADSSTCHILVRELSEFYASGGLDYTKQEEPLQYADLAEWQYELLESAETAAGRRYWHSVEDASLADVRLPSEQVAAISPVFIPRTVFFHLPVSLMVQLTSLARSLDASLASLLLTCWLRVLGCLADQTDLLLGVGYDGRKYKELEEAVGLFAKYLPLSYHLSNEMRFSDAVRQVEEKLAEAYRWQEYFSWGQLEAGDEKGHEPFCAFGFDCETLPSPSHAGELLFVVDGQDMCLERFKIHLSCVCGSQGVLVTLRYDQHLFQQADMGRLLAQWHAVLSQALDAPETALGALPVLAPEERELLLKEWNATQSRYPGTACVQHLFAAQAERTPESIAVVFEDVHLTYRELNTRANRLATYLHLHTVGPEVCVGLCLQRSVEIVVGLLGILKAGGAYVPLDPTYPQERLAFMLQDAAIPILLTQERLLKSMALHSAHTVCLDRDWEVIAQQSAEQQDSGVTVENVAYVMYTSGSTGQPKGVMVPHRGLINYLNWCTNAYAVARGSGTLVHSSFSFDLTLTALFPPLLVGLPVTLLAEEHGIEELASALQSSNHLSLLKLTPAHLDVLRRLLPPETVSGRTEAFIIGGEALNGESLAFWSLYAPSTRLINEYGPTETVVGCCVYEVSSSDCLAGPVPIGRPIANTRLYLLDQYLHPTPIGVPGEIYISGDGLSRGYLNQPELTAEKFIPDPFSDVFGERLYRTGDLARYLPDGTLLFLGRLDHQVKLRGYRIELGEIEAALARHPAVSEVVVLDREDTPGDKRLVAYLVGTQPQLLPPASELRTYLQRTLPDYMLPAFFVPLESLPLTANGKVDRHALAPPQTHESEQGSVGATPRTAIEEIVEAIWCEVLNRSQIGIHENFFDLGGHSLLATRLISQLQALLHVAVSLHSLFETPTIEGLSQQVEQALDAGQSIQMPPLLPAPRTQDLPLSFAQQRLWFLDQLEPDSTAYLVPTARRLQGVLDTRALERSLDELIRRHEILRTTFQLRADQPVQVIHSAGRFRLPLVDLQGLAHTERMQEEQRLLKREAEHPCDLAQGPLVRALLLRLDVQQHMLLLTTHHIISDGWSNEVLRRELTTLYQAFIAGHSSPLHPLPIQYADFALWQRQCLQGAVLEVQLAYWRRQLAGAPPLELPSDYPRPPVKTFHGASQFVHLPAPLHQRLIALSRQEGVTLFMLLLAAFQVLLWRYTDQTDISVGTPIANRTRSELEGLIGFFVNTLVLRCDLSGNPSFVDLLRQVRTVALQAYAHQDIPFEQVVEALQPNRDLSRSPLFQVMFNLQNVVSPTHASLSAEASTDPSMGPVGLDDGTATFDLSLLMTEMAEGWLCSARYNTDLFEPQTITRLLKYWLTLLEGIVAHPHQLLAELPFLDEAEHQLLADWNNTHVDFQTGTCLHELFETQVTRTPDAIAVICEGAYLTYNDLNQRANQLAHHLYTLGVRQESFIGLFIERSLHMMVGMLGILKAGGAYVPLDPASPAQRISFLLQNAQVSTLLTLHSLAAQMPDQNISRVCLDTDWPAIALQSVENPPWKVDTANAAYVIYTSGSTGTPKGVVVEHRQVFNYVAAIIERVAFLPTTTFAMVQPLMVGSCVTMLFPSLLNGGRLHLITRERSIDPHALSDYFDEQPIDYLKIAPSHLSALLASAPPDSILPSHGLIMGGETSSWEWAQRLATLMPKGSVYNHYGSTEVTVGVLTYRVASNSHVRKGVPTPLGRPLANTHVYILDSQLQRTPIGIVGELYLGGSGLARGYLLRPDLTAERFIPHPFSIEPGMRLYKTGDLVRFQQDGNIEFVGRRDDQIKLRGYRIEPGEIEAALRQYPAIRETCVVAHEDEAGDKYLVAYSTTHGGGELPSREIHRFLRARLPDYMVPAAFVWLEALPLTSHGKVDRRTLRALSIEEKHDKNVEAEPRSPFEELLSSICREVLKRERISIYDNFFEVGGHSLSATQVISRLRAVAQVKIPLRTLFEFPTIAGLAQQVERTLRGEQGVEAPAIVPVDRSQALPLSFAQQRLWFLNQVDPGSAAYLIPRVRRLHGPLNTLVLERSLAELVQRHESLRTTFHESPRTTLLVRKGQPVQVIAASATVRLPVIDLQALPQSQRLAHAWQLARQEASQPCDLRGGPLLRTWLIRLNATPEHLWLLSLHHIIADGWSMQIVERDLRLLYQAQLSGQPVPLPPLAIQYADFALWQRQWLQGTVLERQLDYWRRQLSGVVPLQLPLDHPRPWRPSSRGGVQSFAFSPSLSQGLHTLSRQAGVTLFMTLLAGFQLLCARLSGQRDIVVGTDSANRTQLETEGLIGFFINLLALRTDLRGNPSFRQLLGRVRETVLGAYSHQETPFDLLVEHLAPAQRLERLPLVQVLLVLQNVPPLAGAQEVAQEAGRRRGSTASEPGERAASDAPVEQEEEEESVAKFELAVFVQEHAGQLCGMVSYRRELFEAATIVRMMSRWAAVLQQVVEEPERGIEEVDVVTPQERWQQEQAEQTLRLELPHYTGERFDLEFF